MQFSQQVLMRNPSNGVVVLTPNPEKPDFFLRFEAAGDKSGEDTAYVPRETAQLPACINAVRRGLLEVEGLEDGDGLKKIMVSQRPKQDDVPANSGLTAERVVFNEEGKPVSEPIKVTVAALVKE